MIENMLSKSEGISKRKSKKWKKDYRIKEWEEKESKKSKEYKKEKVKEKEKLKLKRKWKTKEGKCVKNT